MQIRVLIIDPDSRILHRASEQLSLQGYTVMTAAGGEEGLRRFREFAPAVVLTELLMPEKDGIECLLQFKREVPNTRVLTMTAAEGLVTREFALKLAVKLGADGVLKKPFNAEQLAQAVESVLPGGTPLTSPDR